ncbi:hemerythrin domain-containing protein [Lutimaribacter sp. EGI FJ00015]|uniref:Hemerythrin domain-containing protein n=1 Tax=Lutimaribacter degradans TaxID=2945989 RepID=A0ACC5ZSK8_9RHOB|nr:hemerythrin domain-containing protein [Lutimaribacter sp. EGI FJ00013]MCM2561257.1 hemerythrin domain-containing protein [Lutimaribacter sp. EGI FJ00013]MCO0611794.1 hemerythrin domain-containing protein [Lutimaribacter sp. EGI FJ00015]MCO0635085.1 hemerythrin domain-containing protein [Lutimaribacter sp. EGI FJ00014]
MQKPGPALRGIGDRPTDPRLLANPLDFICEDHLRERLVCEVIDGLGVSASLNRQAVLTVLRFLNEELNVHLRDEAEDLFPLLARRCTAEDAIENTIRRIRADQVEAIRLMPAIRATLARWLDTGADLTAADRATLTRFSGHVRRHLVAENAILLPIARARLTRADLRTLSRHMRSRRGLPDFMETPDAE